MGVVGVLGQCNYVGFIFDSVAKKYHVMSFSDAEIDSNSFFFSNRTPIY